VLQKAVLGARFHAPKHWADERVALAYKRYLTGNLLLKLCSFVAWPLCAPSSQLSILCFIFLSYATLSLLKISNTLSKLRYRMRNQSISNKIESTKEKKTTRATVFFLSNLRWWCLVRGRVYGYWWKEPPMEGGRENLREIWPGQRCRERYFCYSSS
jgi:hypothetical protein